MKTTIKTIVSCLGFVSSLSLVPEPQLILFKYPKDKRSPVEPQDEKWDLWRAHPKHKTPLVTTSISWHSALILFNIHHNTLTHAQNETKRLWFASWRNANTQETSIAEPCCVSDRSGVIVHLDGVWAQAFVWLDWLTSAHTSTHSPSAPVVWPVIVSFLACGL